MMAENSKIEWTDHTFNPWIGCTKVSDGCKNCYAEQMMDKRYGRVKWGPQGTRVRTSKSNWNKPLKWNREAERLGVRYRVFCASLADVFEHLPGQALKMHKWREELFGLIGATPNLDWLLLTKRPENVNQMIEDVLFGTRLTLSDFDNVWTGTSVENQEQADKRIPELLKIPASVRFLSMEPLLGAVDLSKWLYPMSGKPYNDIDWVIVGGESGPNARPMHPDWARSIRDQCQRAGVPFFFKQWGEWLPSCHNYSYNQSPALPQHHWVDGPLDHKYYIEPVYSTRVGKKAAGRLLDGAEWSEFPEVHHDTP